MTTDPLASGESASGAIAVEWLALLYDCLIFRLRGDLPGEAVECAVLHEGAADALTPIARRVETDPAGCTVRLALPLSVHRARVGAELLLRAAGLVLHRQPLSLDAEPVRGNVEAVRDYCLVGWVSAVSGDALPPGIISVDGEPAGTFEARLPRADLNEFSPLPHTAGFMAPIPAEALDGEEHALELRFGGHVVGARRWKAAPRHRIGLAGPGHVEGWFHDDALADAPVSIALRVDGRIVQRGRATPHPAGEGADRAEAGFSLRFTPVPPGTEIELCAGRDAQLRFAAFRQTGRHSAVDRMRRLAGEVLALEAEFGVTIPWRRDMLTKLRRSGGLASVLSPAPAARAEAASPGIAVVVPVYRGMEETRACLASLAASLPRDPLIREIVLIDDASPEPGMAALLAEFAARGEVAVRVLANARNKGFVASVNRAIEAADPACDVIVLNADTVVPPGFAGRLHAIAGHRPDVASVTPLSNNGMILGAPRAMQATGMDAAELAGLDGMLRRMAGSPAIEIPTGIGFCLYITRRALADVGAFGREWGRGYCEEVDWCLRARDRGWRHFAAADCFVLHRGEVSFTPDERARILEVNHALLARRYPDYDEEVKAFLRDDPLRPVRVRVFVHLLRVRDARVLLHLTHGMGGGTATAVASIAGRFAREGGMNLVCAAGRDAWLESRGLDVTQPERGFSLRLRAADLPLLAEELRAQGATEIRALLHSVIGAGSALADAVGQAGLPYSVMVHDYQWFCPRATLVDGTEDYCGQPASVTCQGCVRENDIHDFAEDESLIRNALPRWVAGNAALLRGARAVIAPSRDAERRIRDRLDLPNVRRVPHPEPVETGRIARGPDFDAATKIAVVGGITLAKGSEVLRGLAEAARGGAVPLRLRVIGEVWGRVALERLGVEVTGRYAPAELAGLLRGFDPHFVFFPGVWPETHCFVLSEIWAAGYPAVAFDIGAIAERIRATGAGVLLPRLTDPAEVPALLEKARARTARLAGHAFPIGVADPPLAEMFVPPPPRAPVF